MSVYNINTQICSFTEKFNQFTLKFKHFNTILEHLELLDVHFGMLCVSKTETICGYDVFFTSNSINNTHCHQLHLLDYFVVPKPVLAL